VETTRVNIDPDLRLPSQRGPDHNVVMTGSFDEWIEESLAQRRDAHQFRQRRTATPIDATHVELDGRRLVNFASNDYLGLTHHPRMLEALRTLDATGSGAAGLITGHTVAHARAEVAIAAWKQTESALLLPSGYQANVAAVQTLAAIAESTGRSVRFLIDKLAHASLIDALRMTGAELRVFPHNHLDKLARLLADAPADQLQVVLTESIFSMDGDAADLRGLAALKAQHPFVLLLDEAHGSGVYGPAGAGLAAEMGLSGIVDISIVTLSKALGLAGGAIAASQRFVDAMLNFGRAYIYSTAVPPATAALTERALEILRTEPQHQARVRALAARVRTELAAGGQQIPAGDSPIIPIVMGDESDALAAAARLEQAGLLAIAVRPPTVPKGTSRLRVTLSAAHTDAEVALLVSQLLRRA
jgi:8-amino-7-oxononanoate synthase